MPHTFEAGDRVFVLFLDTSLVGVIEGSANTNDEGGRQWNVRTEAAAQAYPVPESCLRLYLDGPELRPSA